MEVKLNKKVIEIEETVYIAYDGKEFISKEECKKYENELIKQKDIELAERLIITEYQDMLPISIDGIVNDNNTFQWYKVHNLEEFKSLNKAYQGSLSEPKEYPEVYCVETCGYEVYKDDAYEYKQSEMLKVTREFWGRLGYKVEFFKD